MFEVATASQVRGKIVPLVANGADSDIALIDLADALAATKVSR